MRYECRHTKTETDRYGKNRLRLLVFCLVTAIVFLIIGSASCVTGWNEKPIKETKPTETETETQSTFTTEKSEETMTAPTETTTEVKETKPKQKKSKEKSVKSSEYLFSIDNPDYNYKAQSVYLSDSERIELAHLVMGESGGEGFEGCCLLAQAVRDAMVYRGYGTISEVISGMRYYGYKYETCDDVENAIDYIFVEGNSAVQHRILYMYDCSLCEGEWHETQEFIIQYNTTRFFDSWED